jgi:hypothetical protein
MYAYANPAHINAGLPKPSLACCGTGLSAYSSFSDIDQKKLNKEEGYKDVYNFDSIF